MLARRARARPLSPWLMSATTVHALGLSQVPFEGTLSPFLSYFPPHQPSTRAITSGGLPTGSGYPGFQVASIPSGP